MMQQHQPNQNFNGGQQHQQQQQDPSKSVYVGNIAWRTTEQEIGDTFANFGYVNSVKIITDKETGRSKGFGFVEFADAQILHTVIQQMNGYNLNGRQLRVNMASGTNNNGQNNMGNRGPNMGGHMGGQMGGHMGQQMGGGQMGGQNQMHQQPNMGMQQNQGGFQQQPQMGGFQNQGF